MKILFLGAAKFQTPVIRLAKDEGHFTITLDNIPSNPGHRISDKSYDNISTLDIPEVLKVAKENEIDGILSFGSDVAMETVAVVAKELGLFGPTIESVNTLTNKYQFRSFLNDFNLQKETFYKIYRISDLDQLRDDLECFSDKKFIIKPVDSSGSKGVDEISFRDIHLCQKFSTAMSYSRSSAVIVEEYINKVGPQICGDGLILDGVIKFICFGDGVFYDTSNQKAPYGEKFPSSHEKSTLDKVKIKLEHILNKAGYLNGVFNLDVIIDQNHEPYVIEIGPRAGGNYIPSAIKYSTGTDLISASLNMALGLKLNDIDLSFSQEVKPVACYMMHVMSECRYEQVDIDKVFLDKLIEKNVYIEKGKTVTPFTSARDVIGNLILGFESINEMDKLYPLLNTHIKYN